MLYDGTVPGERPRTFQNFLSRSFVWFSFEGPFPVLLVVAVAYFSVMLLLWMALDAHMY